MWHDGLEVKHERTRTEAGGRLAAQGQRGTCCCVGASQHPVSCERAPAVRVTSSCMRSSFSALPKEKLKIYIFCENLPEQWHTVNFSICQAWHRMMHDHTVHVPAKTSNTACAATTSEYRQTQGKANFLDRFSLRRNKRCQQRHLLQQCLLNDDAVMK